MLNTGRTSFGPKNRFGPTICRFRPNHFGQKNTMKQAISWMTLNANLFRLQSSILTRAKPATNRNNLATETYWSRFSLTEIGPKRTGPKRPVTVKYICDINSYWGPFDWLFLKISSQFIVVFIIFVSAIMKKKSYFVSADNCFGLLVQCAKKNWW